MSVENDDTPEVEPEAVVEAPEVEAPAPEATEPEAEAFDWTPYEELGLNEVDPEALGTFLEFVNSATSDDPDVARTALTELADSLGIDVTAQAEPADETPRDPGEEALARLEAREAEEAQRLAEQQALERLDAEWASVQEDHGKEFTPGELAQIQSIATRLAASHDEPIRTAYDLILEARGDAEAAVVEGAPDTPSPAVPAGHPSTAAPEIDDFEAAREALIARRSGS